MREHDCPRHLVLGDFCSNGDGMRPPVDIIHPQAHDFFSAQCSIVREQHNRLISCRELREHKLQDGFPLALVGNPWNGGGSRDEASLVVHARLREPG